MWLEICGERENRGLARVHLSSLEGREFASRCHFFIGGLLQERLWDVR